MLSKIPVVKKIDYGISNEDEEHSMQIQEKEE
jgi:hypothetical protein